MIDPSRVDPPKGTYIVTTDFFEDCAGKTRWKGAEVQEYAKIPYAVQIRNNGNVTLYCNYFVGGTADEGDKAEAGVIIAAFQVQ